MKKKLYRIIAIALCMVSTLCFSGCSCMMLAVVVDEMLDNEVNERTTEESTEKVSQDQTMSANPLVTTDKSKATVLIYMNGSDLETDEGQATEDITEMIEASYSEDVNVLIQTMGTRIWDDKYDIASYETQRFQVMENDLELVEDGLGQLDCTSYETLRDFIKWGADEYPAERYILILWNHGGGPVYGFGYDEFQSYNDSLTLDEMQKALKESEVSFDFIGMDCCIMSCLEVCYALYDYCDYMILSEEFESGIGWSYCGWLNELARNPEISTQELAVTLIDDMISDNEASTDEASTLALIDQSMVKVLYRTWQEFAYANEETLLNYNFSMEIEGSGRKLPKLAMKGIFDDDYEEGIADYYITDIMAVAKNVDSKEAEALSKVLDKTILYFRATDDVKYLSGLAVTLPYGDSDYYYDLKEVFTECGFDSEYVDWLEKFTNASGVSDYYDYESGFNWEDMFDWDIWGY